MAGAESSAGQEEGRPERGGLRREMGAWGGEGRQKRHEVEGGKAALWVGAGHGRDSGHASVPECLSMSIRTLKNSCQLIKIVSLW